LTGALEDYYASPIGVEGKVYLASEHGKVVVLRAAAESGQETGNNRLVGSVLSDHDRRAD
jgi:hypothetical protein